MDDIVPELIKKIEKDFQEQFNKDSIIADLIKKLEKGTATHSEAYKYAGRVGTILTEAYKRNISSDALPEGKMWYNIANRVITPTMKQNYDFIAKYVDDVQENLNKKAGIGIKAVTPQLNNDRIKGIVNRISSEDNYDNISWILNAPVKTAANSIVDDSVKANSEFHAKAGMQPRIIRKTTGKCCKWCTQVAGIYEYPNVPKDVYRRHENCDCTVEYDPGDGKRQKVYSKQWKDVDESDKINARKSLDVYNDRNEKEIDKRKQIANNTRFRTANMPEDEYWRAKYLWQNTAEIDLPQKEKEYVYEELDNNLTIEEKESCIVTRAIENKVYKAINRGHNQYKIIDVYMIEPDDITDQIAMQVIQEMKDEGLI